MNVGPYIAYILYILFLYPLYKKGVLGVQTNFITCFYNFLAILTIKMADFLKLELFLRPSLKTRSHDRSAHTFGSSHRFLEVPQKGV